jgi:hypothetical membrane protein
MDDVIRGRSGLRAPDRDSRSPLTKSLLGWGVLAGPFYVAVVLGQALTRPGFDITRHDASLLSNGAWGWVQIANFVLTGLMVIACAAGVRRALGPSWAPRLLAVYGLGLIGGGVFVADPMAGFPPGTPAGRPEAISLHSTLHIVCAAVGFLCFIAACFVMARRFAGQRRRAWTLFSIATGVAFLAGFAGVASGSGSQAVVLAFWAALILAWSWLAALAVHLHRRA